MATAKEIEQKIFAWAPKELAEDWDNVGLLIGGSPREVRKVLVSLDVTEAVADEAIRIGAQLIVSHHPVMNCAWHEVQSLREDDWQGHLLRKLVKNDLSVICMHTNLDAASGGVNDVLAQKLGLEHPEPFNDEKIGRIGTLSCALPLEQFLQSVIESLDSNGIRYIAGSGMVKKVAVGGGACRDFIPEVIAAGCDTYVTADLRYNDFLDTKGLNLIDAGHFPTENVVCGAIVSYLKEAYPAMEIVQTTSHTKEVIQYYK